MATHHFGTSMSLLDLGYDIAKQVNDENALIVIELQLKKLDMYYKRCTLECVYLDKMNNWDIHMLRHIYLKKPKNFFKVDLKQVELYLHNLQQSSIHWEKYYNGVNIRRKKRKKKEEEKVISWESFIRLVELKK